MAERQADVTYDVDGPHGDLASTTVTVRVQMPSGAVVDLEVWEDACSAPWVEVHETDTGGYTWDVLAGAREGGALIERAAGARVAGQRR